MSDLAHDPLIIDDPRACGVGEGAACCGFFVAGAQFMCGRSLPGINEQLRHRLDMGTMNAKGDPGDTPFPQCQTARLG